MDDRSESGPRWPFQRLRAPGQGVNMAVRYLGLILPTVVTYWFSLELDSRLGFTHWTLVMVSLGAAIWIAATATLVVKHDRNGAAAISVFYVLVDAWWWTIALGVIHFD